MNCNHNHDNSNYSRRDFLTKTSLGIGGISLASMLNAENTFASVKIQSYKPNNIGLPHFVPKVKRVIYLFQSGAPSQQTKSTPAQTESQSFEIPSKESCESWYNTNVKVNERKQRKMFSNLYYHEYKGKQVIGYVCSDEPPQ